MLHSGSLEQATVLYLRILEAPAQCGGMRQVSLPFSSPVEYENVSIARSGLGLLRLPRERVAIA